MMNRPYYYPYSNPINVPSRRTNINPLSGRKTPSMRSMIHSVEHGVDTISSLIPLYKKVKPVIDQGKTALSSISSFFIKKDEPKKKETKVEHVEAEVIDKEPKVKKEEPNSSYRTEQKQAKPFFQ